MIKARLTQKTENPLKIMYDGCKVCTSGINATEIPDIIVPAEKMLKTVLPSLRAGHPIAEHVTLTWAIDGIDRVISHQLVRHRHASFLQQSQRAVDYTKNFQYSVPDTIKPEKMYTIHDDMYGIIHLNYIGVMDICHEFYKALIEDGIPPEDARRVLPGATLAPLIETMNLRELIHICHLRLCLRAETEMRKLVQAMVDEVLKVPEYEFLKEFLVPGCYQCTEQKCPGGCK